LEAILLHTGEMAPPSKDERLAVSATINAGCLAAICAGTGRVRGLLRAAPPLCCRLIQRLVAHSMFNVSPLEPGRYASRISTQQLISAN
jgi:hypothetical protein